MEDENIDDVKNDAQIIKDFLQADGIDKTKWLANFRVLQFGSEKLYVLSGKDEDINHIIKHVTESIKKFLNVMDRPLGLSRWFIAGYPDVVSWFSQLDDEKMLSILGASGLEDALDAEQLIRKPFLRNVVNAYLKTGETLECGN